MSLARHAPYWLLLIGGKKFCWVLGVGCLGFGVCHWSFIIGKHLLPLLPLLKKAPPALFLLNS
ncbi:MAG: hypothetical protein D6728_05160 [Cyanobacteria bacterium J055]|nr:MAG: hypothetical protein D6728_05160 [Cyanobacteria bacterium J055]